MTAKKTSLFDTIVGIAVIVTCIATVLLVPELRQRLRLDSITVLSDKFDKSNGSYDTNIWNCAHECKAENIVQKDGVLNLMRNTGGFTSLVSRSKWSYNDLLSLTGKFQIGNGTNYSTGWIGLSPNIGGCFIGNHQDVQSPYILCESGNAINGEREYTTEKLSIAYDKWYEMKMEFSGTSGNIKFYIDDTLLGNYVLSAHSESAEVSMGIFSDDTISSVGNIYIDDIEVTLSK